jgi:hypothetical protein
MERTLLMILSRAQNLKEKQPGYYRYLVGLFEYDPDRAPNASPVASAY